MKKIIALFIMLISAFSFSSCITTKESWRALQPVENIEQIYLYYTDVSLSPEQVEYYPEPLAIMSATNFNALFTRLDDIRKKHLNANGQSSAANTRFSTAFSTNIAAQGVQAVPDNVQRIKDNLTTLAESAWLDTTFAS